MPLLDETGRPRGAVAAFIDVTARKQADDALRESERRFRDIAENAAEWVWEMDAQGKYTYSSPVVEQLLGYKPEKVLGKHFYDFFCPDEREELKNPACKRFAAKLPFRDFLNPNLHKNGQIVWVSTSGVPLLDEQGNLLRYRGANIDITALKQAEAELRESERRFRLMAESIEDVFWIAPPDLSKMVYVSPGYELIWGRTCQELYQDPQSFLGAIHPEDQQRVRSEIAMTQAQNIPWSHEYRIIKPDGAVRWVQDRGFPVRDDQVRGLMFIGVVTDITARKESEEKVSHYHHRLQGLAAQLEEVQETERQRLARELHDRVGQNLGVLGINLNLVQSLVREGDKDQIQVRLDDSVALVEQTVALVRDLMAELRPPELDDYGLLEALRSHGATFSQRTNIAVDVVCEEPALRLDPSVEISLFRIVQEALTTVAKHAQATRVRVMEEVDDDKVRLTIADNGAGFEVTRQENVKGRQGWGLITMTERAVAAGGHCRIESRPGKGTRVIVEVPR